MFWTAVRWTFPTSPWLSIARVSLCMNLRIQFYYVRFCSFISVANTTLCLSLLLFILTSQNFHRTFYFSLFFFSFRSLYFLVQSYFYFSCFVVKVWYLSYCGSYFERTQKAELCFLFFRWSMKTWPVCCLNSSFFLPSQFFSLLPLKSKFYLLLVAVGSLSLLPTSKEILF